MRRTQCLRASSLRWHSSGKVRSNLLACSYCVCDALKYLFITSLFIDLLVVVVYSGGTIFMVRGQNMDVVQRPYLIFYIGQTNSRRKRQTTTSTTELRSEVSSSGFKLRKLFCLTSVIEVNAPKLIFLVNSQLNISRLQLVCILHCQKPVCLRQCT